MLFIDVNIENWLDTHPDLKVVTSSCANCGVILTSDQPFIMKGYAGLTSLKCKCVDFQSQCMMRVSTKQSEHYRWKDLAIPYL